MTSHAFEQTVITSAQNAEVKLLRALHDRKYRKKTGWFLAEGMRICTEAVQMGHAPARLVYAAGRQDEPGLASLISACKDAGGRALPVTESLLSRISRKDNAQMVIGAFDQSWTSLDRLAPRPTRFSTIAGLHWIGSGIRAIWARLCAPLMRWRQKASS